MLLEGSKTCRHCYHLGRRCTFEFVTARAGEKRKILAENDSLEPNIHDAPDPHSSIQDRFAISWLDRLDQDVTRSSEVLTTDHSASLRDRDNQLLELLPVAFPDLADLLLAWNQHPTNSPITYQDTPSSSEDSGTVSFGEMLSSAIAVYEQEVPRVAPNSPIGLLNSAFMTQVLGDRLNQVYKAVFGECASRFLSQSCNTYAKSRPYSLVDHQNYSKPSSPSETKSHHSSDQIERTIWNCNVDSGFSASQSPPLASDESTAQLTLIGIARFLDNFGNLYGNHLTKKEQNAQEEMVLAVVQAFSMQWIPPSDGEERYCDTWNRAHHFLIRCHKTRSFRYIYSVLLFHMVTVPTEMEKKLSEDTTPNGLLDRALQEMQVLAGFVQRYCKQLPSHSIYGTLLETAVSVFQWYGYIRDTVASSVGERPCFLPDATHYDEDPEPQLLNASVIGDAPGGCEHGSESFFQLLRLVLRVKTASKESFGATRLNESRLETSIQRCSSFIEWTIPTCRKWLETLEIQCSDLSGTTQASSALFLAFWSFGVLSFVETLDAIAASPSGPTAKNLETFSKRDSYATEAMATLTRVARLVEEVQLFNLTSELLLGQLHANTSLVVATLVKGIRFALRSNASSAAEFVTIQPLLAWLSALGTTISGSISAAIVMKDLLHEFGDALMEGCF
ncbi:hypothetical protein NA57DRAFT_78958 [Rhizodiscina lignyota]|uniref:Transcription factor domain-containing protein n=1 Tax=Rhizodiscina lignyota TaxID=1504668 RepID=A0A9P4IAM4_9PEZI|nr:hypothetical protein NA57DRAFT_78958 [Rhizodiscina lignyota]